MLIVSSVISCGAEAGWSRAFFLAKAETKSDPVFKDFFCKAVALKMNIGQFSVFLSWAMGTW